MSKPRFSAVFFDLDDTLLDTTRSLVPQALERAYQSYRETHQMDFAQFMRSFRAHQISNPRADFFKTISTDEETSLRLRKAFYTYDVTPPLALMPDAREILQSLQSKYPLFLVTAGNPVTQRKKISLCEIEDHFTELIFVDGTTIANKGMAFSYLIAKHLFTPQQVLCVGNRVDQEIAEGKKLGCSTCLIKYGEYFHLQPENSWEMPDFQISQLTELIRECNL